MKSELVVSIVALLYQMAASQLLRPPPYNLLNQPLGEKIIETGNFINQPTPTVIREAPSNNLFPIPSVPAPSTTIITDCSPEICQNLANTIQLMIVANLLQNQNFEAGRKLATPILNDILSSPILSCGCSNTLSPNLIAPKVISPGIVDPNFAPNVITNYIPSNVVGPSIYSPNLVNPSFVAPTPSVISPSMLPLPPRVVAPTVPSPNAPQAGPANVDGLLNTIMSMLGNNNILVQG